MLAYSQWEVRRRSIQDTGGNRDGQKLNDVLYELRHRGYGDRAWLWYRHGKVKSPETLYFHILTPHKKRWERRRKRLLRALDSPIGTERLKRWHQGKRMWSSLQVTSPVPCLPWRVLPHGVETAGKGRSQPLPYHCGVCHGDPQETYVRGDAASGGGRSI